MAVWKENRFDQRERERELWRVGVPVVLASASREKCSRRLVSDILAGVQAYVAGGNGFRDGKHNRHTIHRLNGLVGVPAWR